MTAVPVQAAPTLSVRDRRLVLALAGACMVWRWLLAHRTPLPGVDACGDLWRAGRLAAGDLAVLADAWMQPFWAVLLAPFVACGAPAWGAAQVLACLCGAGTVVLVAIAAERLRESAGLPAAVLAMAAAGAAVATGAGSAAALQALAVAVAALVSVTGRWRSAVVLVGLVAMAGSDLVLASPPSWWRALRLSSLVLVPVALLVAMPPRPARVVAIASVFGVVVAIAAICSDADLLAAWSPLLAVLAGVGLARLPVRIRDLALCAVVLFECHGAWREIEGQDAVAERIVGRLHARRLAPGERLASDLPRVLWAAGQRPEAPTTVDALLVAVADPKVAFLVLSPRLATDATLAASLAGTFAPHEVSADLTDLALARGLRVLVRRKRS